MEPKYTSFEFKARYYQLGELNANTRHLIFVLHGHGQQAQYFIRKFNGLVSKDVCIVAPEGLSRYYLEGFTGKVGATWMTKEDRLTDIENYITYLNKVYDEVLGQHDLSNQTKVTILGFSQGAATASRWAANCSQTFHQLVLWAGIFPPDLDYTIAKEVLADKAIKYVYGLKDPYLNERRVEEMKQISNQLDVEPEVLTFDGEHVIDEEPLNTLFG